MRDRDDFAFAQPAARSSLRVADDADGEQGRFVVAQTGVGGDNFRDGDGAFVLDRFDAIANCGFIGEVRLEHQAVRTVGVVHKLEVGPDSGFDAVVVVGGRRQGGPDGLHQLLPTDLEQREVEVEVSPTARTRPSAAMSSIAAIAASRVSITDRISVPTLLMGGEADSLFPLSQVDATARQIAKAHPKTPVKVVWHSGGHDGGISEQDRLEQLTLAWFDTYLREKESTDTRFEATYVAGQVLGRRSGIETVVEGAKIYPGVDGQRYEQVDLQVFPQQIMAPAGGAPAAISSLPGLASVASLANRVMPGQTAVFQSKPLERTVTVVGSSRIQLAITSSQPVENAVLFASMRIVTPAGIEVLPNGLVAPLRLSQIGPAPTIVNVALPAIYTSAEPGDIIRVVLSTTDFGYQLPQQAALYTVALTTPKVDVATSELQPLDAPIPSWWWRSKRHIGCLGKRGLDQCDRKSVALRSGLLLHCSRGQRSRPGPDIGEVEHCNRSIAPS